MLRSKDINICNELVPKNYLNMANQALNSKDNLIKELLEKRKLPLDGWPDMLIEDFVRHLSNMDSNNFSHNLGFGEREARIYSPLVAHRHYNFGHGIGRSGNLIEAQPKAAGSTIMANLTNSLLLDLFRAVGLKSCKSCIVVPCATGMTLMLCLLALKKQRPNAKYVLWSRIDQKSCFKCITSAGLIPIIIEQEILQNTEDASGTNLTEFEKLIQKTGPDNIVCIFSTTSCFAPRNPDNIIGLAQLAKKFEVPHLVNNAYGLQCKSITDCLERAQRNARVDMFVQSTDKNLMVPVGGAIISSSKKENVQNVAKIYAGRASSSQTLDVLITLLSLGKNGYLKLIEQRLENYKELHNQLQSFAELNQTKLFQSLKNDISIAFSLQHLKNFDLTRFGSLLYSRGVSGARVIVSGDNRTIDGYDFKNWGAHCSNFNGAYITFAASIGMNSNDIPKLIDKLKECQKIFIKQQSKNSTELPESNDI